MEGVSKFKRLFEMSNNLYSRKIAKSLRDFTYFEDDWAVYHYSCEQDDLTEVITEFKSVYPAINRLYDFEPPKKVSIIIYKDSGQMQNIVHSRIKILPMGIYWLGQMHILAPSAWIAGDRHERKCAFSLFGPMAHEYTHYVIDYVSYGNYPKWLSEGLAQYTEQSLAKLPPYNTDSLLGEDFYAIEEMEYYFDILPNQQLVYLEAFLAVDIIIEKYSFAFVRQMLHLLKNGERFRAILNAKNLNYPTFNLLLQAKLRTIRKIFAQMGAENGELS